MDEPRFRKERIVLSRIVETLLGHVQGKTTPSKRDMTGMLLDFAAIVHHLLQLYEHEEENPKTKPVDTR